MSFRTDIAAAFTNLSAAQKTRVADAFARVDGEKPPAYPVIDTGTAQEKLDQMVAWLVDEVLLRRVLTHEREAKKDEVTPMDVDS
ncbi:MAG TPA: hypothetical protein VMM38_01290 [Aridibacter sp.]|nr:hypothetical protein [Aridibacter sp.]